MKCPRCHHENPEDSTFCGKCATKLDGVAQPSFTKTLETAQEELATGSVFAGRYQVIEELGKGGMGKVYRVLDKKLHEEVALKLIKPEIASDKKTLERFKNELKLARKVVQKNVGRMFDIGEETGTHYITMEYVPGEDLKSFVRRSGQLAVGTTIRIAKQICEGLSEAHSIGIVHRDLKPSNIMIDKNGNARIMDFGIARSLKGKGITGAGVIIGTPEYMSPEQVDGKDADQRSDIYSLGIILYEMLTGRLPFEGETPLSIAVQHRSDIPKDPKEFNAQIPDDLDRIILKCLEKKPEDRYQATGEILSELIKIEQGLPTTEKAVFKTKTTTSKQITVSFTPKKLIIPAAVLAALLITVVLIWKPWGGGRLFLPSDSGLASIAVLNFKNNTGDSSLDNWSESFRDLLITDLSQSRYFRIQSAERVNQILSQLNLENETSFSTDILREIGRKAAVKTVVTGNFMKSGGTLRINFLLLDAESGDLINSDKAEGPEKSEFYPLVDELTRKIKSNFTLTKTQLSSDQDKEVGIITTPYPEAYRLYSEGRRLFLRGEQKESIPLMEKALQIDPNFAMAYRSIGAAYSNIGRNLSKVTEYLTKALELGDRLTDREKLIIQAQYADLVERDTPKSMTLWRKILDEYPEDGIALQSIAILYWSQGNIDDAISYYEIIQRNRTDFVGTYENLGYAYMAKGEYEKARQVYLDHIEYFGESVLMHQLLANSYVYEGKFDKALIEADNALALSPLSFWKEHISYLQGDFENAEKEYQKRLESNQGNWKYRALYCLEGLYRTLGQYKRANETALTRLKLAEDENRIGYKISSLDMLAFYDLWERKLDGVLEKAEFMWETAKNDNPLLQVTANSWRIQVYLEQNNTEKALALAEESKSILEGERYKPYIGRYLFVLGQIEMKRKNYSRAIDLFTRALDMLGPQRDWNTGHAWMLFNLASTYYQKGDLKEAQREYEKILSLTTGRMRWGDLYAKSFYWLGKIHEELGNNIKAVERCEKFLDLWKDADPGLPEVEDTRKRLAGLRGS